MSVSRLNVPTLVQTVVEEYGGYGIEFLMRKRITESDLNKQQNRLLIPKQSIDAIRLMLSQEEQAMANLNPIVTVDRRGLDIWIFTRNKFKVEEVKLQRWDSTGSCVINGKGMNVFRAWSNLNVMDVVEMWGFRDERDGKSCFVVGKV